MASLTIQFENESPRIVPLTAPVTTIGRSVDNVIEVPDPNMSRRHMVVEQRENGDYLLTDCNSANGTKLNGDRMISQELHDGDKIECGQTKIIFNFDDDESGAVQNVGRPLAAALDSFDETARPDEQRAPLAPPLPTAKVVTTRPRPPSRAMPPKSEPEVAVLAHERDDLRKLLEINKRLNQQHDLRTLLQTIIDSAIELMAAERGFLILVDKGEMKIEIARNMSREVIEGPLQVSTQICQEVIETARPVLTTNAAADARYGRYQSVVGLKLRSILCVPFKIKDAVLGTVYLDNANVGAFSERDVDLLSAFSDQAAVAIENTRLLRQARKKERMDQELRIASQIQRKLLPRARPRVKGLEVYGWMHPAKEVGGDYYDWIPIEDDALLICIGDVSGKGVPAGLVMASARTALRSLAERVSSTLEMVVSMNRLLADDLEREMFISFLLMRYDPKKGRLLYTGAGHEHILIWRARKRQLETRKTGGMVLGLSVALEEFAKEEILDLEIGDAVVLYTDGVTEAVNEENEQYQLERLEESVRHHGDKSAREMLQAVLRDVLAWKGRAPQKDDITLLTIKRTDPSVLPATDDAVTQRHGTRTELGAIDRPSSSGG